MRFVKNTRFYHMHYQLIEEIGWMEASFLEYLIDVYDILKTEKEIDGDTYKRIADSFIQEKLSISSPTIKKYFDYLTDLGYIKTQIVREHGVKNRYICLTTMIVDTNDDNVYGYSFDREAEYNRGYNAGFNDGCNVAFNKPSKEPIDKPIIKPMKKPMKKVALKQTNHTKQTKHTNNSTVVNNDTGINSNAFNNTNINNNTILINEIINYLNFRTNSNYRTNTSNTIKLINSLINKNYTLEDFKKVIDNKANSWIGTDYEKYLRPQTLFKPDKFENYLNEKPRYSKANSIHLNTFKPKDVSECGTSRNIELNMSKAF